MRSVAEFRFLYLVEGESKTYGVYDTLADTKNAAKQTLRAHPHQPVIIFQINPIIRIEATRVIDYDETVIQSFAGGRATD